MGGWWRWALVSPDGVVPSQLFQSTEGNWRIRTREKTLEFSSTVLPAPSPYLALGHNYPSKTHPAIPVLAISHCQVAINEPAANERSHLSLCRWPPHEPPPHSPSAGSEKPAPAPSSLCLDPLLFVSAHTQRTSM